MRGTQLNTIFNKRSDDDQKNRISLGIVNQLIQFLQESPDEQTVTKTMDLLMSMDRENERNVGSDSWKGTSCCSIAELTA